MAVKRMTLTDQRAISHFGGYLDALIAVNEDSPFSEGKSFTDLSQDEIIKVLEEGGYANTVSDLKRAIGQSDEAIHRVYGVPAPQTT